LIAVYQDFHFGILTPAVYTHRLVRNRSSALQAASGPSGSQVCAFGMESAGTFDPFPMRFLGQLAQRLDYKIVVANEPVGRILRWRTVPKRNSWFSRICGCKSLLFVSPLNHNENRNGEGG